MIRRVDALTSSIGIILTNTSPSNLMLDFHATNTLRLVGVHRAALEGMVERLESIVIGLGKLYA